ncbi:hypothetical protein [Aequorivita sp. Q41]|uniref:hypothetical protein n=1 Tax=Aequorivita sp. Q41 TaxID=3153300 RepID=UPI0032422CBF
MWKSIIIIGLLITISSCGSKQTTMKSSKEATEIVLGENQVVSYKSLGNGVAAISLELYKNNTFNFNFKSIPQPETDEKAVIVSEKGTYISEGNWKTLNFKNPKFSLAAIFDATYGDSSHFMVLDKENVKINTSKNALPIWGVICEKQ